MDRSVRNGTQLQLGVMAARSKGEVAVTGADGRSVSRRHHASAVAFGSPAGPDHARQALPAKSTVEPRCGSGLAVPAGLVGWLEPGNQAKGGEAS
jgi:hypothetical protein